MYILILEQLITLLNYARDIKFVDKPDYSYIRSTLKTIAENEKIEFDFKFDWNENKCTKKSEIDFKQRNDSLTPIESTKATVKKK